MQKLKVEGFLIGWSVEDITPEGSVSLYGQYYERMSEYIESRLMATACAIESVDISGLKEQAIMVSMDLLCPLKALQDALRENLKKALPDFDGRKLFIHATHTHSAPYPDVESEYGRMLLEQLTRVAVQAWNNREPGGMSFEMDYAVVGHNRRVQYADGRTEMYGSTLQPGFIGLEGPTDNAVGMIFCWNLDGNLTGIIMNVVCPAQVTESKYFVSADYWGKVRMLLKEKFAREIYVLAQCGAAGDISPRDLTRGYKTGGPDMWDVEGTIEIGKRLMRVIDWRYDRAKDHIQTKMVFKHEVRDIQIPNRKVSKEEYDEAVAIASEIRSREPLKTGSASSWKKFVQEVRDNEKVMKHGPWDNKNSDYGILKKRDVIIEQYENQDRFPFYQMELHTIRLGEIAIASNSFELFVDYGFQIMGRNKATYTFIVQLSCDYSHYLATERAMKGGGYSAIANQVGPEGGRVLVEETVNLINSMWD